MSDPTQGGPSSQLLSDIANNNSGGPGMLQTALLGRADELPFNGTGEVIGAGAVLIGSGVSMGGERSFGLSDGSASLFLS